MLQRSPAGFLLLSLFLFIASSCIGGNSEANEEATKAWDSYFTKCGDSWYTAMPGFGKLNLCEYSSVSIKTEKSPLTDADKLNNIEWKGNTYLSSPAERCYDGGWGQWNSAGINLTISLTKRSGQWNASKPAGTLVPFAPTLKKVPCSDIPQSSATPSQAKSSAFRGLWKGQSRTDDRGDVNNHPMTIDFDNLTASDGMCSNTGRILTSGSDVISVDWPGCCRETSHYSVSGNTLTATGTCVTYSDSRTLNRTWTLMLP